MYTLASLYHLRRFLGLAPSDTSEDARLMEALRSASAQIERAAGRRFLPRRDTLAHTEGFYRNELVLEDDLLELEALTDADGAISTADVERLPHGGASASALRLRNGRYFIAGDEGVTVSGIWGWHDDWAAAWQLSGDGVEDNPLSSTALVVTVQDADGADSLSEAPRFQPGQLIAIEQEYLRIISVDSVTNTLHVQRGVGGTTNAVHARYSPISVYQPPRDIRDLTVRWAAALYKLGSPIPAAFYDTLAPLRRERV